MAPRIAKTALLLVTLAATTGAQEPSGPPPPSSSRTGAGLVPHELLPDIGRIGAQVAAFAGPSWNPYDVGQGVEAGGYIDLPLRRLPGGKLSYQIFLGLSLAESDPFTITNPLAVIANLAYGVSRAAPFPVTRSVRTRLRVLHVSPFALKYTLTRWDGARLRPHLSAGVDVLAVFSTQEPERDLSLVFTGGPPFDDPLIAGLVAQAAELTARGIPSGQGNLELGGHAAAGIEVRVSGGLSLNLEYRFTAVSGSQSDLHAATAAVGFHW